MSECKTTIERVLKVEKHPNADRLDIITIKGWQCIVSRGEFEEEDLCVYFPIDSVLPQEIESKIFGPDSKLKLHNGRIKTIKLRGAISQGMVIDIGFGLTLLPLKKTINLKEGEDLTELLGIKKYEPPIPGCKGMTNAPKAPRYKINDNFKKYTDIENYRNYPNLFEENEQIFITEKIHGTNARWGWVPCQANTIWKKILKFFERMPAYEFVYGSHNVQLQHQNGENFYDSNVYWEMVEKYDLKNILTPGMIAYGEIYGGGIQKGYTYGCKDNEHKLVLFDVMKDGAYLSMDDFSLFCYEHKLPRVPVLYVGPFNVEAAKKLTIGDSVLEPKQKVREGIVIKPVFETKTYMGRKVLKMVSESYLLKEDNTEFH